MPIFSGVVFDGLKHGSSHPAWMAMYPDIVAETGWLQIEPGTLNVRLDDYRAYTKARRVDFLISHLVTNWWDCYFQWCEIRSHAGTSDVRALIATTGDNFWGKGAALPGSLRVPGGGIEIMSDVNLRAKLGIAAGAASIVEILLSRGPKRTAQGSSRKMTR
jgi:hypothetical protein